MDYGNNSKKLDPGKQQKHFILTYHCDEATDWQTILRTAYDTGRYSCIGGQLEKGKKSGQIHIQAYIGTKSQLRGSQILKDFPEGAWFKAPNKWQTDRANIGPRMYEYCTKEDTRISSETVTLGEAPVRTDQTANGRRGRDVQRKEYSSVLELAKQGRWEQIMLEFPDYYLKHHTTLKKIHVEDKVVEHLPFPYPLRPWQTRCMELLDSPDDRSIHWFYDQPGNAGKSTFLKWLSTRPGAFYLDGGKKQDNMFLLKQHHTLLLVDLPRHGRDYVPYSTMETFKNGVWTSTKYEGNRVHRTIPGVVIVMANFLPDVTKLSTDRWDIYEINRDFSIKDVRYSDCIID